MRTQFSLCLFLAATPLSMVTAQDRSTNALPKKGDTINVQGCLRGGALESTEVEWAEAPVAVANGLTFRLTGDKNLLKDLRKQHDAHLVSVKGVLKSDLSQQGMETTAKIGGMRIGIGAPSANPASPDAANRRSLPQLEVKSFEGGTTSCAR